MIKLNVRTNDRSEMIDITRDIAKLIPEDLTSGVCHVYCGHTTAGITINENADPDVKHDMLMFFDEMVPWRHAGFRHFEGNSAAHIKASMMGFSQMVPIHEGKLALGRWQSIYFCDFDGPRSRTIHVQFLGGMVEGT